MKIPGNLLLLLLSAAISCGFNWGSDGTDRCIEAKKSAQQLSSVKSHRERKKKEDNILRECPDGAAGRFVAALQEERRGQTGQAIEKYREAIKLDDTLAEAHGNLGLLLLRKGDAAVAAVELKRGLKGKADPRYHRGLGRVYRHDNKFPEAIAAYREALKLDPDNLQAHRELAVLYKKRGMEGAETQYREVLRLKKNDTGARNALMAIYLKNENYDDLFALLKEGVELNPGDPSSHYRLGVILEFRKEYPAALAEYEKTVSMKKDHAKGLNAMARLYLKAGRVEEAGKALEAAARTSEPPRYQKAEAPHKKRVFKAKGSSKKKKAAKIKSRAKKKAEAKSNSRAKRKAVTNANGRAKKKVTLKAKSRAKKKATAKAKKRAKKSPTGKTKNPAAGRNRP